VNRLSEEFGDDLTDDQSRALDDLKTSLVMFGPAREHIKTLYFQWALTDLSRYILYAAIPALIVAGLMVTFVNAGTFPPGALLDVGGRYAVSVAGYSVDVSFAIPTVTWIVSGAFTLTTVPFLLFTSYILRIVTVAKRTLAIGPLILRSSQR
jgi:hypothetical protein